MLIRIQVSSSQINFCLKSDFFLFNVLVAVGSASDSLNDWADEEAGLEAVQTVLDSLDDIHALQDSYVDNDLLKDMLRDIRLHELLRVRAFFLFIVEVQI